MSDMREGGRPTASQNTDYGCSLPVTEQCELLANTRRRHLLRYLSDHAGETLTLSDLTAYLQAVEDTSAEKQIRLSLHHNHLPKLAKAGVVEYRPRQRALEYQPHEQLEKLLAFLGDRSNETVDLL